MKLVVVESPYAGDLDRNLSYLRHALHDCLGRGEAPFASHALYPAEERALGIQAGDAWRAAAVQTVVYEDYGITSGMRDGIDAAKALGQEAVYRKLFEKEEEVEAPKDERPVPTSDLSTWLLIESSGLKIHECPRCRFPYYDNRGVPKRCYRCAWSPLDVNDSTD